MTPINLIPPPSPCCNIFAGPEDVHIRRLDNGLFDQQSVTLTASMHHPPAVEAAGPATNTIWGLPTLAWGILIGCSLLAVLSLATLFLCCWLFPRSRKFLSPTRCSSSARTQITSIGLPFCSSSAAQSTDVSEGEEMRTIKEMSLILIQKIMKHFVCLISRPFWLLVGPFCCCWLTTKLLTLSPPSNHQPTTCRKFGTSKGSWTRDYQ